jgi:hypothetical protein
MNKILRSALLTASLVLAGVATTSAALADTARINFNIYKAGFIVGVSGGKGAVTFHGRTYPIKIGGVSLGATIGASKAQMVGTAFNVHHVSDIAGTYAAAGGGVAVAGGAKVAQLQNSNGVVLKVKGKQIGLEFSIDLSGMEVQVGQ